MRDMVRDWIKDQEEECCEYFEKGKNEALSALDSERNEHAREVEDIKFRCTWLHSDLEQQVADLRKRIAELEAQLQDEQP